MELQEYSNAVTCTAFLKRLRDKHARLKAPIINASANRGLNLPGLSDPVPELRSSFLSLH